MAKQRRTMPPQPQKAKVKTNDEKAKAQNPMQGVKVDYKDNLHRWEQLRIACDGSDAIKRLLPEVFLPKMSGMTPDDYAVYLQKAMWFNAVGRTAEAYKGMILAVPPQYVLPPDLERYANNIDGAGTTWDSFAEKLIDEKIKIGRDIILVDFSKIDESSNEEARPIFSIYSAEQFKNWTVGVVEGRIGFTMAVLEEIYEKNTPDDPFTNKSYKRWRGYWIDENGNCNLNIFDEGAEKPEVKSIPLIDGKGQPIKFIPIVVSGTKGIEYDIASKPILLDLLEVNKSHFNDSAEYEWAKFFVASPVPVVSGAGENIEYTQDELGNTIAKEKQSFNVGASQAWILSNPEAKAYYLSIEGDGLKVFENSMQQKEQMMAALGARVLQEDKKAAEAAETAAIKRASENSILADLANTASEAIRQAVLIWARWSGKKLEKVDFAFNNEFSPKGVEPTMLSAMVGALQSNAISYGTFYENLKSAGFKFQGETADDEKAIVESEKPAEDDLGLPKSNNQNSGGDE